MEHIAAWPLLDQYLDCALDAEARLAVTEHLTACPACRTYLRSETRRRRTVRDRLNAITVPPDLAARIQRALRAEPQPAVGPQRRFGLSRSLTVAVLAGIGVLLVLFAGLQVLRPSRPDPQVLPELATQHTLFGRDEDALAVTGSSAIVAAWLQERVPFSVHAPELPGYQLKGGRLAVANSQRAAQLLYRRDGADDYVSCFIFAPPAGDRPSSGFTRGQSGGVSVVMWPKGSAEVAVVADLPPDELLEVARHWR
jgi:anti-sigma factor RsiW